MAKDVNKLFSNNEDGIFSGEWRQDYKLLDMYFYFPL